MRLTPLPAEPGWARFETRVNGARFTVDFASAASDDPAERAEALVLWVADNESRLVTYCTSALLDTYHEAWAPPDQRLDPMSFGRRLHASSIIAGADGTSVIRFAAPSLFRGHGVAVAVGPDGAPLDAYLEG